MSNPREPHRPCRGDDVEAWLLAAIADCEDTSPEATDLVTALAATLERLTARVSRDLDVDAGESVLPDDPSWADTIGRLAEYSRECAAILDEPRVTAVLTAHSDGLLPVARRVSGTGSGSGRPCAALALMLKDYRLHADTGTALLNKVRNADT